MPYRRCCGIDDIIWVHDYHLIPLAQELRKRGHRHRIGFFLHIPFPSHEIYSATPGYDWLGKALSSYDLVGFQTSTDVENFANMVKMEIRVATHQSKETWSPNRR